MDKRSKQPTVEENLNYIVANMATKENLQKVDIRVDNLETKVDNLETKVDNLETKVDNLETKVDDKFDKMFIAIDNLSNKIEFDQSEKSALIIQVQRNREWLNLIAEKVGVPQPA